MQNKTICTFNMNKIASIANSLNISETIILSIISTYNNMTVETLNALINATTIKGCKFINIKGYTSDKSDNTELADMLMNIGISYENMKNNDVVNLNDYSHETIADLLKVDVMKHDFSRYNLSKFANPDQPHNEVIALLPTALIALKEAAATEKPRKDNNIKLTPVLWFNTETKNLILFGQLIAKKVETKGEYKKTASAPLTIAKDIIRATTQKKSALRTLAIPNILGTIKANGEILEIS